MNDEPPGVVTRSVSNSTLEPQRGSGWWFGTIGLPSGNGLRLPRCQALSAIVGDGAINDRAAIDTLPCVENEKEIREPLQHHQAFALRTFHHFLPGDYVHSW